MFALVKEELNKVKSQKVICQKSQTLLASRARELGTDNIQYDGYITAPLKLNE